MEQLVVELKTTKKQIEKEEELTKDQTEDVKLIEDVSLDILIRCHFCNKLVDSLIKIGVNCPA